MPPAEGFEVYRHKNAEQMTTQGWSGCTGRGSMKQEAYEIRSVTREGEAHSVTGGIFPKEGFEEHYEKTSPLEQPRLLLTEVRKDNA